MNHFLKSDLVLAQCPNLRNVRINEVYYVFDKDRNLETLC